MAPRTVKEALSVWTEKDQQAYDVAEETINAALDGWQPGMDRMWVGVVVPPQVRHKIEAAYSASDVGWRVQYQPPSDTANEGFYFSIPRPYCGDDR